MRYLLIALLPALAGCQSFTKCDEIVDLLEEQTHSDRAVYDGWQVKVSYAETGFKNFNCTVSVSGTGFIGFSHELERRPRYIDDLLE